MFEKHKNDPELMMLKADLLYSMDKFNDAAAAYRDARHNKARKEGRAWLTDGYSAWEAEDTESVLKYFKKDAESAIKRLEK